MLVLERLSEAALLALLARAEAALGHALPLDADARGAAGRARGRRRPLSAQPGRDAGRPAARARCSTPRRWPTLLQRRLPVYDKSQEAHYNLISALHKSVRGSDPDAALYWLCPHAPGRRGPALPRPPAGADGDRGYRPRRPAGAAAGAGGRRDLRAAGLARGRAGAGAGNDLSGAGAQVERGLSRLQGGAARGQGARLAAAAAPHPQRAHGADEAARLRPGLRLRPRRARAGSRARTISPMAWRASATTRRPGRAWRPNSRRGWRGWTSCAVVATRSEADERLIDWLLDGAPARCGLTTSSTSSASA